MTGQPLRASRRFVAVFGLLLAVLLVLAVLGNHAFRALGGANRWSLHTHEVLTATDHMQGAVSEMEAGYRGYALTRSPRYRDQWVNGRAAFLRAAVTARALTDDNPDQQRRLRDADAAFRSWSGLQEASGVLDAAAGREAAIAAAADASGATQRTAAAARLRDSMREVELAETALLRERAGRARALERRTGALLLAGSLLAVLLAGATGTMVARRTARLAAEVRERQRIGEALARMGRQGELILASVAEGICGVDAAGYTLFLNPAAERLLGVSHDAAVGRPVEAVLGGSEDGGAAWEVRETLRTGSPRAVPDARLRRADGSAFSAELAAAPILDPEVTGAVATFRDVSERHAVERMKDEFVSMVSHELRTPLTSIRGSLGLLAAGKLGEVPERGRRMLEIAVQNTDRLVRLINDILDIERIESGQVAMEARPTDGADLVRHAVEVMAPLAERHGVRIEVRAASTHLVADPDRILQVLTNLLSNAVRFSPEGSVVSVEVERTGPQATFRVRDQGRGIPEHLLETVFGRFQQVDSSDAREKGGTGLGLAISRSIVQQHGGAIQASSAPGEGATFTFTLPAADAAPPSATGPDGDGPLVLVCDDDPEVLPTVEEMLQGWGYRTTGVASGEQALREAVRLRPDAILLDMMMPGLSGAETLRALRDNPDTRGIPVVILSALKPVPRLRSGGEAVDWVEKPFGESSLLQALEEAVSQRLKPRRVLVVEDDPDLARVMVELFSRHGVEVLHASTGVEAVEASRRAPPDLVVLDLGLPHGDGYWVVEALRSEEGLRNAPLVVYTARELGEEERGRLRLGHTEFLTKGRVSPDEFERRVVSLLNRIAPPRNAAGAP